jgi:UDP-N-acetylmuramoyl-L-alanyl-D-glutamate--2,6-diaminopimelate ligase
LANLHNYLEALGPFCLEWDGDGSLPIAGAAADSRAVRPGWLFCAIPGAREDGTRYVPDALAKGAVCIVAERPIDLPPGTASILVTDAYAAAGHIAELAAGKPAERLRVLGVTGTNGKTTCAYLLRRMLREAGRAPAMVGTVEYDLCGEVLPADRTTPTPFELQDLLSRAQANGAEDLVMEVSSHALAQRRLGGMAVAGAIFTNLTGDHLDYHRTFPEYYAAKRLLFTENLAPAAPAVINTEDEYGERLHAELTAEGRVRPLAVGRNPDADIRIGKMKTGLHGISFSLTLPDADLHLSSPLIGRHNVTNLAQAATLAWAIGVPIAAIERAAKECIGAPGRLQAVPAPGGYVAYVDYAHTDDALKNVLRALRQLKPNRLLLVFGCGGDRDRTKRPRMGKEAAKGADLVFVTSDNPRSEDPEAILDDIEAGMPRSHHHVRLADRRAAIHAAIAAAQPGDVVLVAGKGHEDYQEIKGVKYPFDDVLEVRAAIDERGI